MSNCNSALALIDGEQKISGGIKERKERWEIGNDAIYAVVSHLILIAIILISLRYLRLAGTFFLDEKRVTIII